MCEFGVRLVKRLLAPARERLGLAAHQAVMPSAESLALSDGPMDAREAAQRREVMVKALWTARTIMIDCNLAKDLFTSEGTMDIALAAAGLADEEVQEAALSAIAMAVTSHEGNCRYLLERLEMLEVLVRLAGTDAAEDGAASGIGTGSNSNNNRAPAKARKAADDDAGGAESSTNASIANDIL